MPSALRDPRTPGGCAQELSPVRPSATLRTGARQAPLFTGILQARRLEWAAISYSRRSPSSGIEAVSLVFPAMAGGFFTTSATWEAAPTLLPGLTGGLAKRNSKHFTFVVVKRTP